MDTVDDRQGQSFVLAPHGGISTGQYLLARATGAQLIAPAIRIQRGAIVLWTGGPLGRLLTTIADHGLRTAPVGLLDEHRQDARPNA
jgi:hypothetical protein